MNKYFAEFFGTFALVFAGTGAIIINDLTNGVISHVGIALTFGLVVMVMIYALGDISGAHFNPAVSVGFWLAKRLPTKQLAFFVISQVSGALLASILLRMLFPLSKMLGTTTPQYIPVASCFIIETILTLILMFVIIHVAEGSKEKGLMAGIAVGGTVGLEALFAGPVTGASMNPARSFAPALVSGHWEYLSIYLIAPFLGAITAVYLCRLINKENCCRSC